MPGGVFLQPNASDAVLCSLRWESNLPRFRVDAERNTSSMNRSRTVGVGLVAALSLALFPATSFAASSQTDSSSGDASIMAPSNPSVSEEDREAADAQQAELDARAARPAPQVPPAPVPSAPSTQTPPLVTASPDGSVGNDKVHILSLSGADCIVVESNGHFGIVDAGDDNDYPDGSDPRYPWRANIATWGQEDQVRPYLDSLGVNSSNLDFFIGTHPHSDHIGWADTLIHRYRPKHIYTPVYDDSYSVGDDVNPLWDNQKIYDDLVAAASWAQGAYGATFDQHVKPGQGDLIQMGDMLVQIIPLSPGEEYAHPGKLANTNLISYTAKITAHGRSAYLSADLESGEGKEDYVAGVVGHVDWLKAGHHGLHTSNSESFLDALSPSLVMNTGYEFQTPDRLGLPALRGRYEWFEAYSMRNAGIPALVGTFTPGGITRPHMNVGMGHTFGSTTPHTYWFYDGKPAVTRGWWKGFYDGWHYFDGSVSAVENGWVLDKGNWYWMDGLSHMSVNTWVQDGDKWYWVDGSGHMLRGGWHRIGGTWYYLTGSGAMATGWLNDRGSWYYLLSSGKMGQAWVHDGTGWYWMDPSSGRMDAGGWRNIWGSWYYLSGSGKAVEGWMLDRGSWYYMQPGNAQMRTGWINDGTGWFLLSNSGAMRSGGWVQDNGNWYWLDGNGKMLTGWLQTGGAWYWLNPNNGRMTVGTATVDGRPSQFAPSGRWLGYA